MNFDRIWMADLLELQKKAAELAQGKNPSEEVQGLVMEVLQKWGINNFPWRESREPKGVFWPKDASEAASGVNRNTDITETKNHLVVETFLPGIEAPNDLFIKLQGDILYITGKSNPDSGAGDNDDGAFTRKVRLPAPVTASGAEAGYQEEKLKIILRKAANGDGETIPLSFFQPK